MRHYLKKEELPRTKESYIYDITHSVESIVKDSKISDGHILVQPRHATMGIYLNESEEMLFQDLITFLNKQAPRGKELYLHDNLKERDCPANEPLNGHSHIKSVLFSNPSVSLIIHNKELQLGTYQRVLLAEFDGPCPRVNKTKRSYLVSIMGE